MARSAKEIVQKATDEKGAKNVDKGADRDALLNNIDRMSHLQEIYKKFDNGEMLTDEERKDWQSLNQKDKMQVIDAYNGVNMNMREPTTFADLDVHSKDYSDLAPETEPKDTESEKVFNPSKPEDQDTSDYDTLVVAIQKLKNVGVKPNDIKKLFKKIKQSDIKDAASVAETGAKLNVDVNKTLEPWQSDNVDKDRVIQVPVWDPEGMDIVDYTSMSADRVIDDLAGKQLTKKQIAHSEAQARKGQRREDKLHQQRMTALPKNQKQSEAEQARITEGYKNEVNPDKTDNAAILARQPDDYVEVKNLENLLKDSPEPGYASSLRNMVEEGKAAGKSFNTILSKDFGTKGIRKLYRMVGGDQDKVSDILDYLETIYKNKKTTIEGDVQNALARKEERALKAGQRAEQRLKDALATKESPDELPSEDPSTKNYSASGKRFNNGPKTELQRVLSGDKNQQLNQAIKNVINTPKAVEDLLKDDSLNNLLESAKSQYSPDFWLNYFKDNPNLSFRITPSRDMMNNATLDFVGEREGHGNSAGGEDSFHLRTGDDIKNFVTAMHQQSELSALKRKAMEKFDKSFKSVRSDKNFAPVHTPQFNFVSDTGVDAQEDAEFRARLGKMLETGDLRWMYQDPKKKVVTTWDPATGLLTEEKIADAIKNKKEHKMGYTIDDNYYNHLLGAMNSDYATLQEALDYASGGPKEGNYFEEMETGIRNKFGKDSADKAKQLFRDIFSFNNLLAGADNIAKLDGTMPLKQALVFGSVSPMLIKQLQNKFSGARKANPDKKSLNEILSSDDMYDILANQLGYNIHKDLDPRWYTPLVTAASKINKYRKDRQKDIRSMVDPAELKKYLSSNSKRVKDALKSGKFSELGTDMDKESAEAVDKLIDDGLMLLANNNEIDSAINRAAAHTTDDVDKMPTIADLQSDKYDSLSAELDVAKDELAGLIEANDGKYDTPEIKKYRDYVNSLSGELATMKYERMPIRELADEKYDGDYYTALQEYLNPTLGDDLDSWYNQILAKKGFRSDLRALKANAPDKISALMPLFHKLGETYHDAFPGIDDYVAKLDDYVEPLKLKDVLKSLNLSRALLGFTPDEFSAYTTNKELVGSDNQSRSLRRHLVGQGKSRGSMGSDAYARADKVAGIIQNAEQFGRTKDLIDAVGGVETDKLKEARNNFSDTSTSLKNLLQGILDKPGEN